VIDTHCHIHSKFFELDSDQAVLDAHGAGVSKLMVVGVNAEDSQAAIAFAATRENTFATIGVHPHEAKDFYSQQAALRQLLETKTADIVAIGECGIDYWYGHSSREDQLLAFRTQLEWAAEFDKPLVFHVRGSKDDQKVAFRDFFALVDEFPNTRGVVHSYTAGQASLEGVLSRSLFVGVNGIATFSKDNDQLEALKALPLELMVLETDAHS